MTIRKKKRKGKTLNRGRKSKRIIRGWAQKAPKERIGMGMGVPYETAEERKGVSDHYEFKYGRNPPKNIRHMVL